ncbi:glycosyltransferase [Burkholderiaceae bacterium DAT-1]|nr:glycosyltransferase [Burkholderiaceae bacterium DAT-1]
MRILMVSDVYFPRVNGVSTSIQTFRRELPRLGVEVDLICPEYPTDYAEGGITRIRSRYLPFDPEDRLMNRRDLMLQLPSLAARNYDLVHVQTPFVAHYSGIKLARQLGVPVLTTYHTLFEEYVEHYAKMIPSGWTKPIMRNLSRSQCNATDGVVAPSVPMRDTLLKYGVTAPIDVIPTGIPLQQFSSGHRTAFRARHDISEERIVALFVGRAAHEKNIDLLIYAADRIRHVHPNFLLLITGEGPAEDHLHTLVKRLDLDHHVRFLGYLDRNTELPDCYAAADIFTFASLTETQGLVVIEAMAAGLPVVAIPAMGVADMVDGCAGALASSNDPEAFASSVLSVIASKERLSSMSKAAAAHAQAWGAELNAEKLLRMYRRTCEGRRSLNTIQSDAS